MARYLAIGEMPSLDEPQFREALNAHRKWRIDRQSFVVKAYWTRDEHKLVVECETPDKSRFENWLANNGWQVDGIYRVDLIHEAGTIWPV